jgi:pectin methylesterase-like acyl-CoA thioesterase
MRGPSLAPAETDTFKIVSVIRWLLARITLGREVLTAARTYYVATTGSDMNDGFSSTNAFATIQKAINAALSVDGQNFNIAISVAAGTYNENLTVGAPFLTSGTASLTGDTTTPSNVVINGGLTVSSNAKLTVAGFKITWSSYELRSTTVPSSPSTERWNTAPARRRICIPRRSVAFFSMPITR